ncbi:class I SAM-dependent methyltransferase [Sphaerimonospora thailandensis]|uniref:Ubiquinone/menaquinone biosynthesis methyltransferase n=1 Tax=Sphaerimonospora thailandensis TaxID=795644 RepID=A0A8J3VX54_9ACTN|nr:class I SAM-dependent methyltransferase [Sphaerimonospora thailandensis]GIH68569.1 ubiquinone/menaquinone biosynthesis methyltransferase [Sphaerimonospora thailandensis]
MSDSSPRDGRLRRYWDRQAESYDRQMVFAERRFFADTRAWVCGQATGDVLEVAVGTGLNLNHYSHDVRLTGVEWSPSMLAVARRRADETGRRVDLQQGDARTLGFTDGRFDTVVCTFSLCAIEDERKALAEMARVLRPGGRLLLADHVESSAWPVRGLQWLIDAFSVPMYGEHWRRRPLRDVRTMGFDIERHDRFKLGIIERFAARKPGGSSR